MLNPWHSLQTKLQWLTKHVPPEFALQWQELLSQQLNVFAKGQGGKSYTSHQKQRMALDLFYACIKHYDWLNVGLFQESVVSLLQEEHRLPKQKGFDLFFLMKEAIQKQLVHQPYWTNQDHEDLFLFYILVKIPSNEDLGLGDSLMRAIHQTLSTDQAFAEILGEDHLLQNRLKSTWEVFAEQKRTQPFLMDSFAIQFDLQPYFSQDIREYCSQNGYSWLLHSFLFIGEQSRVGLSQLIAWLKKQYFFEKSKDEIWDVITVLETHGFLYITGHEKQREVSLTSLGFARSADYMASQYAKQEPWNLKRFYQWNYSWQQKIITIVAQMNPLQILEFMDNPHMLPPESIECIHELMKDNDGLDEFLKSLKRVYLKAPTEDLRRCICKIFENYINIKGKEDIRIFYHQVLNSENSEPNYPKPISTILKMEPFQWKTQ